jgi:hypothetical protein
MPYTLDPLSMGFITAYAERGHLEPKYSVVKMLRHLVTRNEKNTTNAKKPWDEQAFYRESASILEAICEETKQNIPPGALPVPVESRDYVKACAVGTVVGAAWGIPYGWSANRLIGLLVGTCIGVLGIFFGWVIVG